MSKRSKTFAGLSLVVAIAAVGAGALVSANAMAGSDAPTGAATLSIVRASTNGTEPVSCTFEGVDPSTLFGDAPQAAAVVGAGSVEISGGSDSGSGVIIGPITVSASSAAGAPVPPGGIELDAGSLEGGNVIDIGDLPDGVTPIEIGQPRTGTADECAAMLAEISPNP